MRYNITGIEDFSNEMQEKKLGKPKISLQFQLSESGISEMIKAEAAVEETYTVEEEVEVDDDDAGEEDSGKKEGERKGSVTEVDNADEQKLEEDGDNATDSKINVTNTNSTTAGGPPEENGKRKKIVLQQKVSQVLAFGILCLHSLLILSDYRISLSATGFFKSEGEKTRAQETSLCHNLCTWKGTTLLTRTFGGIQGEASQVGAPRQGACDVGRGKEQVGEFCILH